MTAEKRAARWRFGLILLTTLTFLPVVTCKFLHWDDNRHLVDNPLLRLDRLHEFWTRPYFGLYVPVTYSLWTVFGIATGGRPFNPALFHLLNLVVHVGSVLIVFAILKELYGSIAAAAFGASIFAVHPLQVEAVAWISGFRDVLSGFFALVTIWNYLAAGRERNRFHLTVGTIAFVLAMLSKPTVMVTPLICLMIDRRRWRIVIVWLLLALPLVVVARAAQPVLETFKPDLLQRTLVAGDATCFYILKLLWPISLGVDYGRTPAMVLGRPMWIGLMEFIPVILICLSAWLLRRKYPLLGVGVLVSLIALSPMLGLVSFDFQRYSTVADRYTYLAMLGVAIVTAEIGNRFKTRWLWVLPLLLAGRSFAQTYVWHDEVSLFTHALEVNDNSALACSQLAAHALDADRPEESQQWSVQAINRNPNWPLPYVTYGLAAMHRQPPDLDTAERAYRTALAKDGEFGPALSNLAALLAEEHRFAEAEPLCMHAIAVDPSDVSAHINLGNIYATESRFSDAALQYRAALLIAPQNEQARRNLAAVTANRH